TGLIVLLVVSSFLARGPIPSATAADKQLTNAEIDKLETSSRSFAYELLAAGVWTKDHAEHDLFKYYFPKEKVKIAEYDKEKKEYKKATYEITGAEYRYALVTGTAFGNYTKLDDEESGKGSGKGDAARF